eukprot:5185218-Pleurochrysis_carterae.AAC.1
MTEKGACPCPGDEREGKERNNPARERWSRARAPSWCDSEKPRMRVPSRVRRAHMRVRPRTALRRW